MRRRISGSGDVGGWHFGISLLGRGRLFHNSTIAQNGEDVGKWEKTSRTELVESLLSREEERFEATHPRSREVHERAAEDLLSGVPMNWMTRWPGRFPVYVHKAQGAEVTDVDGNAYVDLCLGDTGAMCGHSPAADRRRDQRAAAARA